MLEKIRQFETRYDQIAQEMGKPEIVSDHEKYSALAKEYSDLEGVVKTGREYRETLTHIAKTQQMLSDENDEEMCEMVKEELEQLDFVLDQILDPRIEMPQKMLLLRV